jgi:hypothetical protein
MTDEYDMDICVGENGDLTVEEMDASASACFGSSAVLRMTFALVVDEVLLLVSGGVVKLGIVDIIIRNVMEHTFVP